MASYSDIRKGCSSRNKYADGGRVATSRKGTKTVINIVTAPPAPPAGGMPAPMAAGPAPVPPGPSPSGGAPVPPQAAAMALNQMQGKPQMPGFKRGGRVPKAGAASGVGRLQKTRAEKKR